MRGRSVVRMLLVAMVLLWPAAASAAAPNILFVLTDDQRRDTLSVMPAVRSNFDVSFRSAVVSTPECCPSRATLLTGEYMHDHLVTSNRDHSSFTAREASSLGPWLQEQGYYTVFIGKYFNRYRVSEAVPPGWDEFHARLADASGDNIGDGYTTFALRHQWHEDGVVQDEVVLYPEEESPNVYSTRLLSDLAVDAIGRAHDASFNPEGLPWAVFVWTTAPHRPLIEEKAYAEAEVPPFSPPASYLETDMTDKPREVRQHKFRVDDMFPFADERAARLRMLMSVDDLVEDVWGAVDDFGERDSTWGLFSSDNGLLYGEHWLRRKFFAYEEAIRVPFRLAVPGRGPATFPNALVANIDVAPTLLDVAGGSRLSSFDGRSLVGLVAGDTHAPCFCRRPVLLENREFVRYQGVRARYWKYILWPSGHQELYFLRRDPSELDNLARERRYRQRLASLRKTLERLADS
jgi:arylsulfatase A-like enzyme